MVNTKKDVNLLVFKGPIKTYKRERRVHFKGELFFFRSRSTRHFLWFSPSHVKMVHYHPTCFLIRMKFVSSLRKQRPKALFGIKDLCALGYSCLNEMRWRWVCCALLPCLQASFHIAHLTWLACNIMAEVPSISQNLEQAQRSESRGH